MQFKYPEVFYFTFVLIIPLLIHLFKLQKFNKVPFTNVALLKKIDLESRKSSRLKKWLILLFRTLALLGLLFTFSQPYFSKNKVTNNEEVHIFLDNSLSLNSDGKKGNLLKTIAQEIIKNADPSLQYSLFTQEDSYENINYETLKNTLKELKFSSKPSSHKNIFLSISEKNYYSSNTLNKSVYVSDLQYFSSRSEKPTTNINTSFSTIKLSPSLKYNIAIDSVFIKNNSGENYELVAVVKNQGEEKKDIPLSIVNNKKLASKQRFTIEKNETKLLPFFVEKRKTNLIQLKIEINDTYLFDNTFYVALNTNQKIEVLSIGNSLYMKHLFEEDEFNFKEQELQNLNYNILDKQHTIILNEIENIPTSLQNRLTSFVKNDGHLIIIPPVNANIKSYNQFLKNISRGNISQSIQGDLKITQINFDHALYKNVFTKKVTNFSYPYVTSRLEESFRGSTILSYQNQKPFLKQLTTNNGSVFLFTSSLSNSNFIQSPLIVPTFYNVGAASLRLPQLFYHLKKNNKIEVPIRLNQNQIVKISDSKQNQFIPLQEQKQEKTVAYTSNNPIESGFHYLIVDNDTLQSLAFNYPKEESSLKYFDFKTLKEFNNNLKFYNTVEAFFKEIKKENEVSSYWKLFLALTIVSLLVEIFILKFFKL